MILTFLSVFFIICCFQFFDLNWTIQGLNRAIISTPIELMYRDVYPDGETPTFTTDTIVEHLNDYYDETLKKYVKEYEANYYFYNKEDESMCVEKYCSGVEITVTSTLNLRYQYRRVMFYELSGVKNG